MKEQYTTWSSVALDAFNLAFNKDGSLKNIDIDTKNEAIQLFYNSIAIGADEAWPFIKLIDLIDDDKEKIKLYIRSWRVEENQFSSTPLLKIILQDHPSILDKYL